MHESINTLWMPELLQASPSGILLFDDNNRITWANARMSAFVGVPISELVGMDKNSATLCHLEQLFDTQSTIELPVYGQAAVRILECSNETLSSAKLGSVKAVFYTDITDKHMLGVRVQRLTLSDDLTGTLNERGLIRDLEPLVSRSRRYGNALSIMLLEFEKEDVEDFDNLLISISRTLRDQIRWADLVGRYTDTSFMLVLPETDIEASQSLAEKIIDQLAVMAKIEKMDEVPTYYCGISQWQRGNDVNMLLERANQALIAAREDTSLQYVAA